MSSRKWCFTINNFCADDVNSIRANEKKFEFCICGSEVAPTTGTPHLQGFVRFKSRAYKMDEVQKIVGGRAHLIVAKGTDEQNLLYCSKEGVVVYKYGEPKVDRKGARNDLSAIRDHVLSGGRIEEILPSICNFQQLKFAEGLLKYQKPKGKFKEKRVVWLWGPTGCGKTRKAMEMVGDDYWISSKGLRWWDGYTGQPNVVLDEFRKDFCTFHELLRILDGYPYRVEYKGGSMMFHPDLIVITSCFPPQEVYETREDIDQLLRRITEVVEIKRALSPKKKICV